jgi:Zn-dependent peptidase ImmA (M78 family)
LSSYTRLAIRQAAWITNKALELSTDLGFERKPVGNRFSIDEDPETAGTAVRRELGITAEEQFSWINETEAVKKWRGTLEKEGLLTLQFKMPMDETRAFSHIEGIMNTLVINAEDSYTGRVFSLLHEFCHILLKDPGLCNWEGVEIKNEAIDKVEVFCNHFAGACLVPEEDLLKHNIVKSGIKGKEWPDENLKRIASAFKVSREVILRRLLELGYAPKSLYERKRREWTEELKIFKKKKRKSTGGPSPDVKCLWEKGALFTSLVLMGAKEEFITLSDVAEYLNIKTKYIPDLEKELFKSAVK